MGRPVILIPVKPFAEGKSRLSAVLDGAERAALSRRLFSHVLAQAVSAPADVLVVSRDDAALEQARKAGAMALRESCAGHNPALAQALLALDRSRRAPVLIVSSDLPWLNVQDLEAMLLPGSAVRIATDLARRGTNALYLAQPTSLTLHFGENSRAAHQAAAIRAGLSCQIILRHGLAQDIDTPHDLQILLSRA